MRFMHDAINPFNIPNNPKIVAGYVNGRWPSYVGYIDTNGKQIPSILDLFPNAIHVSIAVSAKADAQVLDCEFGDATPAECPSWALRQRTNGYKYPVIYCNSSTWPQVINEFANQHVAAPLYWIANYDGVPSIPDGAIAKQYQSTPGYDVSVVADFWPGVDNIDPVKFIKDVEEMVLILNHDNPTSAFWLSGGVGMTSNNNSERTDFINKGGLVLSWTASEFARGMARWVTS